MNNNWIQYWQSLPYRFDPVFFEWGFFQIRYYGLMFVGAILTVYLLSLYRIRKESFSYTQEDIADYFIWVILGTVIGGRLGYALFYNLSYFLEHPIEIFLPFRFESGFQVTGISGMSYHGGLLGVFVATFFFCRKRNFKLWHFSDFITVSVPAGYTLGRIGNFLNGELYGRETSMVLGMYFPNDFDQLLRHPSQLYEALFEGIFLFLFLWSLRKRNLPSGMILSLYLIGYGAVRFFIEFTREPDAHLGFVWGALSLGQILCLAMILLGFLLAFYRAQKSRINL